MWQGGPKIRNFHRHYRWKPPEVGRKGGEVDFNHDIDCSLSHSFFAALCTLTPLQSVHNNQKLVDAFWINFVVWSTIYKMHSMLSNSIHPVDYSLPSFMVLEQMISLSALLPHFCPSPVSILVWLTKYLGETFHLPNSNLISNAVLNISSQKIYLL